MSMITAVSWIPRGRAAQFPTKYVFDEEEYDRIAQLAKLELDDAKEDLADAEAEATGVDNNQTEEQVDGKRRSKGERHDSDVDVDDADLKEYNLDAYDDDGEEQEDETEQTLPMFGNVRTLAYHTDNAEDPYITLKDEDASEDEEREELQILATDNLVLAAKVEDEMAHLEVFVYEDSADNLYVHHDIMLPAIPLAVEYINGPVQKSNPTAAANNPTGTNFVAIGTMDPDIEIWNLDLVDGMYPDAVLGAPSDATNGSASIPTPTTKKKKRKAKAPNSTHHVDSVLSLASSKPHPHLLASASADMTVKLWDLTSLACAQSYSHHTDKVCTLSWHPTSTTVLLSGSYDRTLAATDMRAPTAAPTRWGVESDVETVAWDPHDTHYFYASTESGILHCFDARNTPSSPAQSKPVWRLQAHEKSLSSFSVNPVVPGFIATGSTDKTVKLWDTKAESAKGPSLVTSRDTGVGKVFGVQFAPDDEVGFRLAVAGSKGDLQVWDTSTNRGVREAFASRVKGGLEDRKPGDRIIRVESEGEDESDEEGGGGGGGQDGWESMDEN